MECGVWIGGSKETFSARRPPILTLDTLDNERFCSFPHRHGEARDSRRDMLKLQKRAFRARLPAILTLGHIGKGKVLQLPP